METKELREFVVHSAKDDSYWIGIYLEIELIRIEDNEGEREIENEWLFYFDIYVVASPR